MKTLPVFFASAALLGAQVFEPPPQSSGKPALAPELANLPVFDPAEKTFTFPDPLHAR